MKRKTEASEHSGEVNNSSKKVKQSSNDNTINIIINNNTQGNPELTTKQHVLHKHVLCLELIERFYTRCNKMLI